MRDISSEGEDLPLASEEEFGDDSDLLDTGDEAPVFPAPDEKRVGVHTDRGTSPDETDQGDEEANKVAGTPDDVSDGGADEGTDPARPL